MIPFEGESKAGYVHRAMSTAEMTLTHPESGPRFVAVQAQWRESGTHPDPMATMEAKALVPTPPGTQIRLDTTPRKLPDSMAKRRIRKRIGERHDELVKDLQPLLDAVIAGRMRPDAAAAHAFTVMLPLFTEAFRLGLVVAGLKDWLLVDDQIDQLSRYVNDEVNFFRRFMTAVSREQREGHQRRLELYGGAVDGSFWRGWLEGMPSNVVLDWRLGIAEHCRGCLELAANSPYSKPGSGNNPLPTVPRNGETPCLANCKCYLVGTAGTAEYTPVNLIGAEVTAIGPLQVDPTSPGALAAAQLYHELVARYAYHIRLNRLNPTGPDLSIAQQIRAAIADLARTYGHRVRLRATDEEILLPVLAALALYTYTPPNRVDDDLIGIMASILAINEVDRGRITRIDKNPFTVTLDDDRERTYRLDSVGRAILFVSREP